MKRIQIMDALKDALQAAFPGAVVSYWRDRPPLRDDSAVAVVYRDVSGSFSRVNSEHQHSVRVEIEVLKFGADLGSAMNESLDSCIRAIGANPSLGQPKTVCEIAGFAFDTAGDGFEGGVAQLVVDITYRTPVWSGA